MSETVGVAVLVGELDGVDVMVLEKVTVGVAENVGVGDGVTVYV